jgi:hypothetical protein
MKTVESSKLCLVLGGRHLNALECGYLAGSAFVLGALLTPAVGFMVGGLAANCFARL